jgi:hypothetical protein
MFSQAVKEQALVACGRRCCLCHKYCGTKIECNHIEPRGNGGKNTFENCIPLCLDCHAEVGHYNASHPKGNKFSGSELKKHRDRLYEMVNSGVIRESFAPELEKALFVKIFRALGGSWAMLHYKDHDYAYDYGHEVHDRMYAFNALCELPETEFLCLTLETAFADLKHAFEQHRKVYGPFTFNVGTRGIHRYGLPPEWKDGNTIQRESWMEGRRILNESSTAIWKAYARWVGEARRTLHIDIDAIQIDAKHEAVS